MCHESVELNKPFLCDVLEGQLLKLFAHESLHSPIGLHEDSTGAFALAISNFKEPSGELLLVLLGFFLLLNLLGVQLTFNLVPDIIGGHAL